MIAIGMSNLIANHKILVKRLITKLPIMNTITSMKIVEKVFLSHTNPSFLSSSQNKLNLIKMYLELSLFIRELG